MPATTAGSKAVTAPAKEELDRTDDPVRMYLREMGSIELLSRQGEIDIAKRIEAGREKMIGGICESPLTLDAIVQWRDELKNGTTLLREIVDLGATYGKGPGSPGHGADAAPGAGNGQNAGEGQVGNSDDADDKKAPPNSLAALGARPPAAGRIQHNRFPRTPQRFSVKRHNAWQTQARRRPQRVRVNAVVDSVSVSVSGLRIRPGRLFKLISEPVEVLVPHRKVGRRQGGGGRHPRLRPALEGIGGCGLRLAGRRP